MGGIMTGAGIADSALESRNFRVKEEIRNKLHPEVSIEPSLSSVVNQEAGKGENSVPVEKAVSIDQPTPTILQVVGDAADEKQKRSSQEENLDKTGAGFQRRVSQPSNTPKIIGGG